MRGGERKQSGGLCGLFVGWSGGVEADRVRADVWMEGVSRVRRVGLGGGDERGGFVVKSRCAQEVAAGHTGRFMGSAGTFSLPGPLEQTVQGWEPRLEIPASWQCALGQRRTAGIWELLQSHGPCLAWLASGPTGGVKPPGSLLGCHRGPGMHQVANGCQRLREVALWTQRTQRRQTTKRVRVILTFWPSAGGREGQFQHDQGVRANAQALID